ncbi:glycoside hydrolase family 43 protein [Diplodia corticola]|uniref:Glycoside hydrolase family 43 protein n=1 Tax=Diplodia corticola TaxID=236234 RepID=A0A1J9R297_9PEZI|nr:glycoside hydrolase family 43 protein [Diplodia corticola]OJD34362.1 glycoside hydrolase family 43 protein [Diplodia corticola]
MFCARLFAAVVLAALVAGSTLANAAATKPSFRKVASTRFKFKEILDDDFADPSITKFGDMWYAYATVGNGINAQLAISSDGNVWTLMSGLETLPNPGPWADQSYPGVWAPDVTRATNGEYVMYYSAKAAGIDQHCIGVGIADNPTGPFIPLPTPLACPVSQGGAIDPAHFWSSDGRLYVVYKIDGNNIGHGGSCNNAIPPIVPTPIVLQQLDPRDGYTLLGNPFRILDRGPEDGPLIEAPSLTRTPDGKFVLFYSSNCYDSSSYDIAYAWADRITGPYVKIARLAVTGTSGLYAPGGADVSPDGSRMVFHASDGTGRRVMFMAKLAYDSRRRLVMTI